MLAAEIYGEKQIRMIDVEEPTLQGSDGGDIIFQPELACLCGSDYCTLKRTIRLISRRSVIRYMR